MKHADFCLFATCYIYNSNELAVLQKIARSGENIVGKSLCELFVCVCGKIPLRQSVLKPAVLIMRVNNFADIGFFCYV